MTVSQALNNIITNFGIDILKNTDRVQSMVMDLAGNISNDTRLFCIACRGDILNFARDIHAISDTNQAMVLAERAKENLKQNMFMAEESATLIVNMILEGVGKSISLSVNTVDATYLTDSGSNLPEDSSMTSTTQIKQLLLSSQEGDLCAMIHLGECYQYGDMVKPNWRMAEYYYRKAIESGQQCDNSDASLLVTEAKIKLNKLYNLHPVDHGR